MIRKYWQITGKTSDKIIACSDTDIIRLYPKASDVPDFINTLQQHSIPQRSATAIPYHYIREVHMEEGKNSIKLFYSKSSEDEINCTDQETKAEIFDFLKTSIPKAAYARKKYSKIMAAKNQLIILLILTLLFFWVYDVASGMEDGYEYALSAHRANGIIKGSVILTLAGLGKTKLILLFSGLFLTGAFAAFRKMSKPKIVHKLLMER